MVTYEINNSYCLKMSLRMLGQGLVFLFTVSIVGKVMDIHDIIYAAVFAIS